MEKPTARQLRDATGISPSYAHMILKGERKPARPLAICIYRSTGWRHDSLVGLTEKELEVFERHEPYPSVQQAAA